ncbi:MAG TPA: hypothetical protein DD458_20225 [Prolixibacteraceae bacterium]|nr:MAG: hypothetical protein A2W92_08290 [Bacteroidetes bacterium GWA2_42_15]OFY02713.1 MAG: hypothetical protein A2W89_04345 [Bacteroidetes bacterium GWE2_42_39]HBL77564.1 hypothetical protein [Prolixibacteraceae bacterium]HCR90661.1 hypothetical protein [Prolixibacteraceae bacterium]HCU60355.1 hypothetical protein [Prolixibacteraceae bacterium]
MKRLFYPLLFSIFILFSCSTGKKALERGDYYEALSKAVERLQSDPDNRNAIQVIEEGYSSAISYYQEEIDLILTGNDRFKWGETVRIMEKVNKLSEQIRKVPAARNLISDPKTYISEMRPAKEKAAGEVYNEALELMKSGNKSDARQAYLYFVKADQLIPGYEDVNRMIIESKKRATYIVIVEQIPVFSELYNLSAVYFYDRVLGMLKYSYPEKSFVNFYSENEAGNFKIEHPDMILKMNFYDFHIGRSQHNESEQPLSKVVEERVKVNRKDTVVYETKVHNYKGTIKIINDQVLTEGLLKYEIFDFQANNSVLMTERIPGQFMWSNAYGIFVGDKEVLDSNHIAILNNRAYPMPSPQDLFIEFSKPVFDQLSSRLRSFFRRYEK